MSQTLKKGFDPLFKKGKRFYHGPVMLVVLKAEHDGIAFCTSKIPLATARNRRKRIMRAAVYHFKIKPGFAVAMFARDEFENMKFEQRVATAREVFKKAKLI